MQIINKITSIIACYPDLTRISNAPNYSGLKDYLYAWVCIFTMSHLKGFLITSFIFFLRVLLCSFFFGSLILLLFKFRQHSIYFIVGIIRSYLRVLAMFRDHACCSYASTSGTPVVSPSVINLDKEVYEPTKDKEENQLKLMLSHLCHIQKIPLSRRQCSMDVI